MKTQYVVPWLGLILLTLLFLGCTQSTENATTPPLETLLVTPNTGTSVPSLTPLPTDAPAPPPTSTAIPTLPVEEARTKLLQLLLDNGSCRLPCLWDLARGKI